MIGPERLLVGGKCALQERLSLGVLTLLCVEPAQGLKARCNVWVLGPDAEFEILAPAFDTAATWTDAGGGAETLIYAYISGAKRGQLVTGAGATIGTVPVARLVKVNSATKITIGGLR